MILVQVYNIIIVLSGWHNEYWIK